MERLRKGKDLRVRFDDRKVINRRKSTNPLAKLTYRELQHEATKLNLPANFKHKILLALVIAHRNDRKDIVKLIIQSKGEISKKKTAAPDPPKTMEPVEPPYKNVLQESQVNIQNCSTNFDSFSSTSTWQNEGTDNTDANDYVMEDINLESSFSPNSFTRLVDLFQNFNDV